jgi:CBS domain containing-hemolysin-like protein
VIDFLGLINNDDDTRLYNSGDIEFAVEESFSSGYLEDSDQLFIENILDLDERTVAQAMTPRNQIHALSVDLKTEDITDFICNSNKTRYPIYQETLDHIVGILHMKDLARFFTKYGQLPIDITDLARPALYIPESLALNTMLAKFKQRHTQIAVVLDEFGGTLGIITLEDLIEEVVGEIQDEFDLEVPPIQHLGENRFRVRGDVILDELTQHLSVKFSEDMDARTIGGYVMEVQGAIPQQGDELFLEGMTLTVERVLKRAVQSLHIEIYPEDYSDS